MRSFAFVHKNCAELLGILEAESDRLRDDLCAGESRLVAFAATPEELAKRVSQTTPSYRELLGP